VLAVSLFIVQQTMERLTPNKSAAADGGPAHDDTLDRPRLGLEPVGDMPATPQPAPKRDSAHSTACPMVWLHAPGVRTSDIISDPNERIRHKHRLAQNLSRVVARFTRFTHWSKCLVQETL
jgi:hypothetical protein